MEVTVDIRFDQLLDTIKKLPAAKIKQLKSALDEGYIETKANEELSGFQNYLLDGPVMDADQYAQFKENRKHFSTWRQQ
ncbi:hypothetical protein [Parapedobacter sp. 2B3]|uniref:hypothetical protein n=1 Tax=Parapedobacter sp. 2B3 TaxID=3342381 RepID=UPI0035B62F57